MQLTGNQYMAAALHIAAKRETFWLHVANIHATYSEVTEYDPHLFDP
jgi:hypothetical protein